MRRSGCATIYIVLAVIVCTGFVFLTKPFPSVQQETGIAGFTSSIYTRPPTIMHNTNLSIAFLGNSILYYNDCPRLVENILSPHCLHQNSCLRGGATLPSLYKDGNGMRNKFGPDDIGAPTVRDLLQARPWNYVIMNDHTQSPARVSTRQATLESIANDYAPCMLESASSRPPPVVLLLQTAAYRKEGVKQSDDLGDFDSFTEKLTQGYRIYQEKWESLGIRCQIVPFGLAVQYLRQHDADLWQALYNEDDFHPSPCGTYLEACCISFTILKLEGAATVNPILPYSPDLFQSARYFAPPNEVRQPLPTPAQAERLSQVAHDIVFGTLQPKL